MSIFLETLPNYYHYSWTKSEEEPAVQSAIQLLNTTKDTILSNYINQYSNIFQQFQKNTGINLTDEQNSILDFAAEDTLTAADLEQALSQSMNISSISGKDIGGGQQLISAVQELKENASKSNKNLTNLSNLMDAFVKATDLYQQVEDMILGVGGKLSLTEKNQSVIVRKVVRNILASPNGSQWTQSLKGQTIQGLTSTLNQWLILLYALTNNQVPRGNKTAIKTIILDTVTQNFTNLIGSLGRVGTLTASTVGTIQLTEAINKNLTDMKSRLRGKANSKNSISYSIKINNDEYSQSILSNLKGQLLALNGQQLNSSNGKLTLTFPNTQTKANQQVWSSDLKASINNVTVKTTTSIKTLKSGTKKIGSINLQSSTSLLSLLYRELGFSSSNIIGLLQIAVSNGTNGTEADNVWNNLREYTKKALLIPALTGLNRESFSNGTLATMIKINDYLIPMPQFINYLQAMLMQQTDSLGNKFSGYISLEGFPNRSSFTALNQWEPPALNNWIAAKRRSLKVETSGMSLLQSAKIRMRLRNLNLSMLINSAI